MNPSSAYDYRAPLADYEREAEVLFAALQSGNDDAAWRFKWEHPRFRNLLVDEVRAAKLDLADAQWVVARGHAFEAWKNLSAYAEAIQHDDAILRFETAVETVIAGDLHTLRVFLRTDSTMVRARSTRRHHATLLHYIGANGVEGARQKTPANAVEVAKTLLEAGAEVDALADMYDSKCTTMSMLVSSSHPYDAGLQAALAETLLDYGAAFEGPGSNWQSALMTALAFGYLDTATALARRGSPADTLPAAAGLGRILDATRLLPTADAKSRHVALSLAAQLGHVEVVRLLLDAGEDPDRYNLEGFHAHSTPLHQAVCANHADVVRLLVERGARLDLRDTIYQGTPLDWAEYLGKAAIAAYLRGVVQP
jgi:ankyrin repeat protein